MSTKSVLIILVIILAVTAWYFANERNRVISSHDFTIKDTSLVDKIVLEKENQRVKLEKVEGEWMVNNAFHAKKSLVKRFLKIFSDLNLVAPVSNNCQDSILKIMEETGMKISVYYDGNLHKEYLLGDLNVHKSGNYLYLSDKKFGIIRTSGLVNDLKGILSVDNLFWRNRMVFNKNSGQIVRVTHLNIKDNKKSYTIYLKNNELGLLNNTNEQIRSFNKTAIGRYLSYFQNIGFKQIETSLTLAQKDSIRKLNLAHTITLVDNSNNFYELNLYLKPAKITKNGMSKEYDLNLIYGIMNYEENMLVFEYYIIDPILKDVDYFNE